MFKRLLVILVFTAFVDINASPIERSDFIDKAKLESLTNMIKRAFEPLGKREVEYLKRAFEPLGKRSEEDVNLSFYDLNRDDESRELAKEFNELSKPKRGFEPLGRRSNGYDLDVMFQNLDKRAFEPLGRRRRSVV